MSPDTEQGYPAWEQELDSLLRAYESGSFTRSILQVYTRDCPVAVQRLLSTIKDGDVEQARNANHSLSNIMGVVGPALSRSLIEGISANLKDGQLESAVSQAKDLESMVQLYLISIQTWLENHPESAASPHRDSRGDA